MKKHWNVHLSIGLATVGLIAFGSIAAGALAQDEANMRVEAPKDKVTEGGGDFQVDVLADGVSNIAAFEFKLSYDPAIIKYVGVEGGPFLSSSGRDMECMEPSVDAANPETLSFTCTTLGPPPSIPGGKAGANGSGVLATVTFSPIGDGVTPLDLKGPRYVAAELNARGMPVEVSASGESSTLEVAASGGMPMALLGVVIGAVAAVVVLGLLLFLVLRTRRAGRAGEA